jgi:hypothetical protein
MSLVQSLRGLNRWRLLVVDRAGSAWRRSMSVLRLWSLQDLYRVSMSGSSRLAGCLLRAWNLRLQGCKVLGSLLRWLLHVGVLVSVVEDLLLGILLLLLKSGRGPHGRSLLKCWLRCLLGLSSHLSLYLLHRQYLAGRSRRGSSSLGWLLLFLRCDTP